MSTVKNIIEAAMAAQAERDRVADQLRLANPFLEAPAMQAIRRAFEHDTALARSAAHNQQWQRDSRIMDLNRAALAGADVSLSARVIETMKSYAAAAERANALLNVPQPVSLPRLTHQALWPRDGLLTQHMADAAALGTSGAAAVAAERALTVADLHQRAHEYRMIGGAFAATAEMRRVLEAAAPIRGAARLLGRLDRLTATYADVIATPRTFGGLPEWLVHAPPVDVYTGTRLIGVASGVSSAVLDDDRDELVEAHLAESRDRLEERLASVGPEFADAYRGASRAIDRRDADWMRHACVSMRELMIALLEHLAPNAALTLWRPAPSKDEFHAGLWTRRGQLRYVFRDARAGGTERIVDGVIDLVLGLFFPQNAAVHTLLSPHRPQGMQLLFSQFQGHLATILDVAGY